MLSQLPKASSFTTGSTGFSAAVSDQQMATSMRPTEEENGQNYARNRWEDEQIANCKRKILDSLKQFDDDALIVDCKNKSKFL